MSTLIDRLLLFLLSMIIFSGNQEDYFLVSLILGVIIMEGLIFCWGNRRNILIMSALYIGAILWQPEIVFFGLLIIYECAYVRAYYLIPIHIIMLISTYLLKIDENILSDGALTYILFLMVGLVIGIKSNREKLLKTKVHDLQDEESYSRQKNIQSREEILKRQDYEIHAATLSERNRIAREIHDNVGHMLSRSILQLGAILAINKNENLDGPLRGLKDSLDTAMNNIRESVHDIKDEALDLEYMVKNIAEQFNTLSVTIDYDMGNYLSKEIKYCFVAIVKEALTNTVKHSDATAVKISLREHPAIYQMLIEDNGSKKEFRADKTGIGLDNMRERVSAFNGNIRFTSERGFRIFISIPKGREG